MINFPMPALLQAQEIVPLPDSQRDAESEAGPSRQSSANERNGRQRSTEDCRPAKRARLDVEQVDVKPDIAEDGSESDGNELSELKVKSYYLLSAFVCSNVQSDDHMRAGSAATDPEQD